MTQPDIKTDMDKIVDILSNIDYRLNWDEYFISLAFLISKRSLCNRLHVGCILVKDSRILGGGYNGFLAKAEHKSVIRNNHEQMTMHSEANAISICAKLGISTENSIAYITHYPCLNCFKILASAGIKQIKYYNDYNNDELVKDLALDVGISVKQIK